MKIKTVTTVDGINSVDFGDNAPRFYWFKNLSDSTLYVSSNPNMIVGGDDVSELQPKSSTAIETTAGIVYVLGAGKVEIHNTDSKFCPFRGTAVVSGGGESEEGIGYISDGLIIYTMMDDRDNIWMNNPYKDEILNRTVNCCNGSGGLGYRNLGPHPGVAQLASGFTLQVLCRTSSSGSYGEAFGVTHGGSAYTSASLGRSSDGYFAISCDGGIALITDKLINDDKWHMLNAAYADGLLKMYVDGIEVDTKNCTFNIPSFAQICIGLWDTNVSKWNGYLANACIYNRALTDSEIMQNWQTDAHRYKISN